MLRSIKWRESVNALQYLPNFKKVVKRQALVCCVQHKNMNGQADQLAPSDISVL